jgi:hypothetical protein
VASEGRVWPGRAIPCTPFGGGRVAQSRKRWHLS